MAFTQPNPAEARRRLRLQVVAILIGVALLGWYGRDRWLTALGTPLASEDPLVPVDVMVLSSAAVRFAALEGAELYRAGISPRVVLVRWRKLELEDEMRRLGVPWLPPTELAVAMLERSGVPSEAIRVLPGPIDGLNTEVAAIARYVHDERPASLLYVAPRDHTRRARWLFERLLPDGTKLLVHAPRTDPYHPDTWWHSREGGREVAMEYLRWANTFVFRDPWSRTPPNVPEPGE